MRRKNWAGGIAVVIALFVVLVPILWTIRVALRPTDEYVGAPAEFGGSWTLHNFETVWISGGMGHAILNSILLVGIGGVLSVTLASLSGFALARYRFKGRGVAFGIVTVTLFLPSAALVIPLFELAQALGILDSVAWLGVIYGAIYSAWATIFMRSYFLQFPEEVFEAGQIDGASRLQIFTAIALPMAKPAIATAFILTCFLQWSELLLALILLPSGDQTVAVAISQFSTQFRTGGPLTAAAMIVGTAPILLLFIFGQRWLQAGALSGAVKD